MTYDDAARVRARRGSDEDMTMPRYTDDDAWPSTAKTCRLRLFAEVEALRRELESERPRMARYAPDFTQIDGSHVFIQWKGTDVCLDFRCECGAVGHYDGYFAYSLHCESCGRDWDLPHSVTVIPAQRLAGADPVTPTLDG